MKGVGVSSGIHLTRQISFYVVLFLLNGSTAQHRQSHI